MKIVAVPKMGTLENAMQLTDEELNNIGKNGRRLVEEKYNIQTVAENMHERYEWILGKREKPESVIIN